MQNRHIIKLTVLAAACFIALPTLAEAAGRGGDRGNDHERGGRAMKYWRNHGQDHENGCAIGNDPPPGANCTNRYDQQ